MIILIPRRGEDYHFKIAPTNHSKRLIRNALGIAPAGFVLCVMYDGCNFDIAPLRLSNPSLLLMFKELCARRLLSAGENKYSTGYILCQQKIYFFSKIFHFFRFFSGEGKQGNSGRNSAG